MGKILDNEFRKSLYKNLIEAGYSKEESQKIVGKKYYVELLSNVSQGVDEFLSDITQEKFEVTLDFDGITKKITELKKLKELLKEE